MSKLSMPKNKLFTALFAALALVPAALVSAAPAAASSSQVLADCNSSGHLTGSYSRTDLQGALSGMGADTREYTNCYDVVRRALLSSAAAGGGRAGGGGASGGGNSSSTSGARGGLAWQPGCLDPWRLFQGPGRNVGRVRQRWRRIARRFDGSTREHRSEHELRRAVASRSADRRARAARARRDRRRGDRTAPSCRRSPRRIAPASPRRRGRLLGPGWRAGSRARTCSLVSRWPPGCAQKRS